VKLAVNRARAQQHARGLLARRRRAHDAQIIAKVENLPRRARHRGPRHPHPGARRRAQLHARAHRKGQDTISVTGNVLRDYLTDLFPILEVGTSAKMLSIVPLMNGGGLFETGAGGSAPKHVQQFQ
jgi:isocitrate dehydrogenase